MDAQLDHAFNVNGIMCCGQPAMDSRGKRAILYSFTLFLVRKV